jgi:hypothetical protein
VVRKVDPIPVDIVLWLDVVHEPHAVFEWTNPALGEVVPLHHACEIARGDEQTLKGVLNAGTCACVHVQRVSIRLPEHSDAKRLFDRTAGDTNDSSASPHEPQCQWKYQISASVTQNQTDLKGRRRTHRLPAGGRNELRQEVKWQCFPLSIRSDSSRHT